MYKHADEEWQLEKSASLAVLRGHRASIEALLADIKYDKIAHVRQVSTVFNGNLSIPCMIFPVAGWLAFELLSQGGVSTMLQSLH